MVKAKARGRPFCGIDLFRRDIPGALTPDIVPGVARAKQPCVVGIPLFLSSV
jgi:hypothetical protein